MGGDIALRGGAESDLLAVYDCARLQCGAARHGLGPSAQLAVSGVRGVRRMARGRRRQQEALAVDAGSAWRAGTGLRPALRRWLRSHGAFEGTRIRTERPLPQADAGALAGGT